MKLNLLIFVTCLVVAISSSKLNVTKVNVLNAELNNPNAFIPTSHLFKNQQLHVNWTHIDILVDKNKKATNSKDLLNNPNANPHDKIPNAIDKLIKKAIDVAQQFKDPKKVVLLNETIKEGVEIYNDIVKDPKLGKIGNNSKKVESFLEKSIKLLTTKTINENQDDEVNFHDAISQVKAYWPQMAQDEIAEIDEIYE